MKKVFILTVFKSNFSDVFTYFDFVEIISSIGARQLDSNRFVSTDIYQSFVLPQSNKTKRFILVFVKDLTHALASETDFVQRLNYMGIIRSLIDCVCPPL